MLSAILSLVGGSSKIKYFVIAIVVLAVAGAFAFLMWDRAEKQVEIERTRAELLVTQAAYNSARASINDLKANIASKDEALALREQAINTINADREALRRRWQEALRNEPDTRDWADTPLPDSVCGLLQQAPRCDHD